MTWRSVLALLLFCFVNICAAGPWSTNGNRLAYLDSDDPFYPSVNLPKLATPQWVGEEGVDAVIILAIDDLKSNEPRFEAMLRPILNRLKQIDGRATASIMVNHYARTNLPQLESWLAEGVSLECHSSAHPCPLCQKGDFTSAVTNYHACVDLLHSVSNNKPVAFRMPCCDSMNSPTPRFYSEIFDRVSAQGHSLQIDSSVMVALTTNDSSLPRELVIDKDGRERFRKYFPSQTNATTRLSLASFATTIEDYPYPYVIGGSCWEFPCIVPSDWEAHNLHGPTNAVTVEDWERALDAVVLKRGVMTFIFHPHNWIRSEQMVQFIDYAAARYGRRVKFLNFKEAAERLTRNLLHEKPLRDVTGKRTGVRVLDLNNDGWMDVLVASETGTTTRIWEPNHKRWHDLQTPFRSSELCDRFGIVSESGNAAMLVRSNLALWEFTNHAWHKVSGLSEIPEANTNQVGAAKSIEPYVRMRDVNGDGRCELIFSFPDSSTIYERGTNGWQKLDYALPPGTSIVDSEGRDAGLRFVDVDGDGYDDVLFSNSERYSLHIYRKDDRKLRLKPGWTDEVLAGPRVNPLTDPIPPIVRAGTNRNNGAWFARGTMWVQNEDAADLPDRVDRRTFKQLLTGYIPSALAPREAERTLRVHPGFKVELVAAEPLTADPIAFEWSADGRLWVVEMGDYPLGVDGRSGGRVQVLEDTDGDGRYDKATTFLEGLNFPTGIYPWRKGVVISGAPEIFYAEDTDGDGKADVREVLFTGFIEGNQQHRVNGFDYALDGWLYAANGDSGGSIRAAGVLSNIAAITLRGHDLRIHPDKRLIETVEGQTQYGRHRDDWDNWFGNNNPTWLWHYYFSEHYLARNPYLPVKTLKKILANYPEFTRCFPISRTLSRFNDPHAANHVTSACSSTAYRDDLFGPKFENAVFVCEPVHNLVHCEVLQTDGVTFSSQRLADETNSDFFASTDNWFRPVFGRTGPDGALYIADMYRFVIEHPQWIPIEMQRRLDLRAGADKGRIYRVYPEGAKLRRIPNLAKLSSSELATALDSSNGWQRDTAQRLLIEHQDRSVAAQIEKLAAGAASPKVRVQALWTLRGLAVLQSKSILAALHDRDARVREHAVRLGENLMAEVLPAVIALAGDPSPRVRYQVAFSLGQTSDPRAVDALLKLALDEDENVHNAAASSASPHAAALQVALAQSGTNKAQDWSPMLKKLIANPRGSTTSSAVIERTNAITAEQRAERTAVVHRYSEVSGLHGDAKNGRVLFEQNCAVCHRHRGLGNEVGPDLGIMSGKAVEQVVEAVLNPNAAVEDRFRSFSLKTTDDREFTGVVVAETPTSLTVRAPNMADETVLRSELSELTISALSLMPEGFETAFNPQQLADVAAFVLGH